jgi:hypothetical protein
MGKTWIDPGKTGRNTGDLCKTTDFMGLT